MLKQTAGLWLLKNTGKFENHQLITNYYYFFSPLILFLFYFLFFFNFILFLNLT